MTDFTQNFTITQSNDCSTLSLQDSSNFGNNNQGYTYSTFNTKNFTIYNFELDLLATIPFVDNTPITYTIGKDLYLVIKENLQAGSSTPLVKVYNTALSCFVDLKYGDIVADEYNNLDLINTVDTSKVDRQNKLFNITKGIKAAQIFASIGNGALSQNMLDYANSFANTFVSTPTS